MRPEPLTPAGFAAAFPVSRETLERLGAFVAHLARWQARINLVATASLADVWRRHVLDSAQLLPLAEGRPGPWLDFGSGGGFPGLVVSLLGRPQVHLVERDARKAVFLREAARLCAVDAVVHHRPIEALPPLGAAVLSARAVAPLAKLLRLAEAQITPETLGLFLKGQDVDKELTEAARYWIMRVERLPSMTDPTGVVLRLRGMTGVGTAG